MKRIIISSIFFLTFILPLQLSAADTSVQIQWAIPTANVAAIQNYIINYSPYSDMRESYPLNCDPWETTGADAEQTTFSIICHSVPDLQVQPAYFALVAQDIDGTSFISETFSKFIILPTVADFRLVSVDTFIETDEIQTTTGIKLNWTASSDIINNPFEKSAVRVGDGEYVSAGCFLDNCYDNKSTDNYVSFPIVAGDILNQDDFQIEFYFNPQTLGNYDYLFGIGSDTNNSHLVHMYEDGRLYCRSILNGTSYYGFILNSDNVLEINTWYKLTYSYSRINGQIRIFINDELRLEKNTTEVMQGEATNVYLAADSRGTQRTDCLLDELTIK
ncbi:LamG-like jellyroll fold domain-containing protein [Desulforhopalus sp. IMCC35007]|uniref:LamG-like jellyroll fold domain-containing protein n=1 Tax=Desulforhopalus sp. IMCC35007 TaxID=2569543 RepID=UPI0010AE0B76|nr:LamG-like jellyroll fold domain-containing protein [Desulforhopalus sp. IMCC35007]TKB07403.1 LamG domain-containing protein [Desulforhopalus sp. IMCC35007]